MCGLTVVILLGCEENMTTKINPASSGVRFAVVSSTYKGATSIALLGADGDVADEAWLGSYTANPKLRTPLTEDVVLPTVSASPRVITTLERGMGVVSRFDLESGSVIGQVRTDDSSKDDEVAYGSNPHDVLYVNDKSAWVSRWEPNLETDAEEQNRGNDLIEINPTKMVRTNRRIDLSQFNQTIRVPTYDEDSNVTGDKEDIAYARPSGMVSASGFGVVALSRLTSNYQAEAGSGLVAIVDFSLRKVTGSVELEGLQNCSDLRPVVKSESRVLVECAGSWTKLGQGAGIAMVEIHSTGKGSVIELWRSADHEGAANTQSRVVSLGGTTVVAVAPGERDLDTKEPLTPDILYVMDLATGKQKEILASKGVYSLGNGAYDSSTSILLIPDAGEEETPEFYGVRRFKVNADFSLTKKGVVEIAPDKMLPARQVSLL
jgi:hypothetical protein